MSFSLQKKWFIFFIFFTISQVCSVEYQIKKTEIIGAKRIDKDAVKSYINNKKENIITSVEINQTLQNLYETGYFKDVNIIVDNKILKITVKENPSISKVFFEGNNEITSDILKLELGIMPRHSLSFSDINDSVDKIKRIYRYKGYFLAKVEPKIIKRPDNRVDIVFEISEGNKTKIGSIIFLGNNQFSDNMLAEVIYTKETRWYRFFASSDNYDPDRVSYDKELIRLFYLKKGYADCNIKSAIAELTADHKEFFITFTIDEGISYKVGKISIDSKIKDIGTKDILNVLKIKTGDDYNNEKVEESIAKIVSMLGEKGYAFVDVNPMMEKNIQQQTIDFKFQLSEGSKVFIEKITIKGNIRTNDNVIRRELLFYEGDAFDVRKMHQSERRIRNLGFFKQVKFVKEHGIYPDRVNLIINVEEDDTAEISGSGGFSTESGLVLGAKYAEHNFGGKGQSVKLDFNWTKNRQEFDVGFTEPYFMGKNIFAGINIYSITHSSYLNQNFDERIKGVTLTAGYALSEYIYQNWSYTLRHNNVVGVDSDASQFIKRQKGKTILSEIGLSTSYDKRDNRIMPQSGWIIGLSNNIAGLGGNIKYMKNTVFANQYYTLKPDYILSISAKINYMFGLGQSVRISDRYSLGGDNLRGFEAGGIGPRDKVKKDVLGGLTSYVVSAEMIFPVGLPKELGVKGALFADAGNLWKTEEPGNKVINEDKIRMSIGFGVRWRSPFGPLKLDFARAIRKSKYDEIKEFHFGVSTRY